MTLPSPKPNSSLFLPHHPHHPHLQESDQTLSEHDPQKRLEEDESSRERLKRHRMDVAGHVWIPDKWGKEEFLKDWIDGSAFEASLFPSGIMSARHALARDAKRLSPNNNAATATATAAAGALRILNSSTC